MRTVSKTSKIIQLCKHKKRIFFKIFSAEILVKFYEESELIKLKDALEGLRQTQAYLGLVDMLEWVLKMTNDRRNTFEAAQQFIEYLVVDNIYTENYLATSSNVPGSPYRAMVGHEEM